MIGAQTIRMAVIGCGRWGPNHARVIDENPKTELAACVDSDPARRSAMIARFGVPCPEDTRQLSEMNGIDAVVVATPVETHFSVVTEMLDQGYHVLCEKPLSSDVHTCIEMGLHAQEAGKILMVGHIFLFNDGIRTLAEIVQSGHLGDILYVEANRTNLGPVRTDVGAAADLATHDISILNFIFGKAADYAGAVTRLCSPNSEHEDVVFAIMRYGDVVTSIHASWAEPIKTRTIKVVGSRRTVVWDDLSIQHPITIYDRGSEPSTPDDFISFKLARHDGGIHMPTVEHREPLATQLSEFVACIGSGEKPLSDAVFAASVASTLQAIEGR